MPVAYPKRIILWQSGKTFFFSPAPIRLLTKEPVTPANALTITENSAETLLTMFDTANSVSPKRSIATKNRNQMATLVKNWSILHTEIENTSFNIVISIRQYKPYTFLSMCLNIYAANTASEHISADEEAIAAPDIPISKPNIRSQFSGIFTSTAVKAAMFRDFVCVIPTKNERKARNGKENNNPQIRQSK